MVTHKVNAKGMQCPGPIVEVFKTMRAAQKGDLVEVEATDIGFYEDIKAWCKKTGNDLVTLKDVDSIIRATLKKA